MNCLASYELLILLQSHFATWYVFTGQDMRLLTVFVGVQNNGGGSGSILPHKTTDLVCVMVDL